MRIGIPRALFYYHYYPLWRAFFDALGATCVVSPPTHKGILVQGTTRVTGDNCLPLKVYLGHVLSLVGQVDYLFVPLIRTLESEAENCARLRGLPDLVRLLVPEAPPLLAPEVNVQAGERQVALTVLDIGRRFTLNPLQIKAALNQAFAAHEAYQKMLRRGVPMPAALAHFEMHGSAAIGSPVCEESSLRPQVKAQPELLPLRVALVGHAYNLYDEYVNHRLIWRLRSLGVEVLTPDAAPPELAYQSMAQLGVQRYWTYEHELVGAATYYLSQKTIGGVVSITTFGCGPDSVMLESLQKLAGQHGVPFLNLVFDEQTGEAGLVTRLEAFVDMLESRLRGESFRDTGILGN